MVGRCTWKYDHRREGQVDNTGARATSIQDRDVLFAPRAGPLPLPSSSNEMRRYVVPRYSPMENQRRDTTGGGQLDLG
jgi:hypothetical protein